MLNSDINESSVSWLPPSIPRYSEDTENEDHSLINLTKDVIDIVLGHCGITISDTTSSLFSFHMEDTNEADRGPRFFPSPFISPIRITRTFLEDRRASRSMLQKPACTKTIDNKFAWQIYHIIFKKWIMRNSLEKWFPDIKTGWRAMWHENNQSKHGVATCDKLVTQSFMWHIAGQHVCVFFMEIISRMIAWQSLPHVASPCFFIMTDFAEIWFLPFLIIHVTLRANQLYIWKSFP